MKIKFIFYMQLTNCIYRLHNPTLVSSKQPFMPKYTLDFYQSDSKSGNLAAACIYMVSVCLKVNVN